MHVLMIASENDALSGGKVGGLGDVIRDIPIELEKQGQQVSVVTPGYGILANKPNSVLLTDISFPFAKKTETASLYRVQSDRTKSNVTHYVLEHWVFSAGGVGNIYTADNYGPFATDGFKFSLFSAAVCECIKESIIKDIDIIHCHDWHASTVLILKTFSKRYSSLKNIYSVFSIHNISIQGLRPFENDDSSLFSWFPDLLASKTFDRNLIADKSHPNCVNFMRAGINLADKVHTVSPTYAKEILQPSHWEKGFVGGEGLERDLLTVKNDKRLIGIINGINYPDTKKEAEKNNGKTLLSIKKQLSSLIDHCIDDWARKSNTDSKSYYFALRNLQNWQRKRSLSQPVMISIGRMTKQKLGLLTENIGDVSATEKILSLLDGGIFIMLGSGDLEYDYFFTQIMKRHSNFIFLSGYSEELSDALFSFGDIFMMPSLFEPCGITQMLAMREGMPCIGHNIGGLADTIVSEKNGYLFEGKTLAETVANMILTTQKTIDIFNNDKSRWEKLCDGAKKSRFTWDDSAKKYIDLLYSTKKDKTLHS